MKTDRGIVRTVLIFAAPDDANGPDGLSRRLSARTTSELSQEAMTQTSPDELALREGVAVAGRGGDGDGDADD